MYAAFKKSNKSIIAYHKKLKVIINYCDNYNNTNDDEKVIPIELKDKKAKQQYEYEDLYLVRYGDTYIQSKYLFAIQLNNGQFIYDLEYARDVILRIVEFNKSKKDEKYLSKTLDIIEREIDDAKLYTPSIEELERQYMLYEEYKNKIR